LARTEHILGLKTNPDKGKRIGVTQNILSDQNETQLEFNKTGDIGGHRCTYIRKENPEYEGWRCGSSGRTPALKAQSP
jgi:hypothetical protein